MSSIGDNIREHRQKQGLTQDEMAARLFVTRQTVSNYERGTSEPDLDMLRRIAELLQTDAGTLLGASVRPAGSGQKKERLPFFLGAGLTAGLAALVFALGKQAFAWKSTHYDPLPYMRVMLLLSPLIFLSLGWTLAQGAACLTKLPTLPRLARATIRLAVSAAILVYLAAACPHLLRWDVGNPAMIESGFVWAADVFMKRGRLVPLIFGALLRLSRGKN